MSILKNISVFILSLALSVSLYSCSRQGNTGYMLDNGFLGSWQMVGGNEVLIFSGDGKVSAVYEGRNAWSGNYKIVKKNKAEISTAWIGKKIGSTYIPPMVVVFKGTDKDMLILEVVPVESIKNKEISYQEKARYRRIR